MPERLLKWRMRIIPAYAGSTRVAVGGQLHFGDHPRVCGEHVSGVTNIDCSKGSSPRMRGAPNQPIAKTASQGIIPAYAGSTGKPDGYTHCKEDHPRVCGEHRHED